MLAGLTGLVGLVGLTGCGGSAHHLAGPDATPATRTAEPTAVDICALVPSATISGILDRPLLVVGRTVGAARNATLVCEVGERFADPLVSVALAPDPVARDVFDEAYGDEAGGNPVAVSHLGDAAYVRTEGKLRAVHVFVHGAVLSVDVTLVETGADDSITRRQLIRLTRAVTRALPDNPKPEPATAPPQCRVIGSQVLVATLGRPPTLDAGVASGDGSLECSWGGQPGSVTMAMTGDPGAIAAFRHEHVVSDYVSVPGVLPASQGKALSSPETAGDLVVFVRSGPMVSLRVVPASGYAESDIDTTPGERTLARAVLTDMADLR